MKVTYLSNTDSWQSRSLAPPSASVPSVGHQGRLALPQGDLCSCGEAFGHWAGSLAIGPWVCPKHPHYLANILGDTLSVRKRVHRKL